MHRSIDSRFSRPIEVSQQKSDEHTRKCLVKDVVRCDASAVFAAVNISHDLKDPCAVPVDSICIGDNEDEVEPLKSLKCSCTSLLP